MRLISCHIENFGRLHDYDLTFKDDINSFCQDNGWGKSTLAAFLRVMFFGLQNEGKRNDTDNDRRHYKPWQGGNFGGSLVFEVHGVKYRVTRQFKDKESEDFFELRFADTNLISEDYSKNLGEEIFRINNDSFIRTVFISQNDCRTNSTDSINAKIGNISDNTGDIDSFENANNLLLKYLRDKSPKTAKGQIRQLQDEKSELYTRLLEEASLEGSIRQYENRVNEHLERIGCIRQEKRKLKEIDDRNRRNEALKHIKENYNSLLEEEKLARDEVDRLEKTFPGKVLSLDELDKLKGKYRDYLETERLAGMYSLTMEEETRLKFLMNPENQTLSQFPEGEEARLSILTDEFGHSENYFDDAAKITSLYGDYQRDSKELMDKEENFTFYDGLPNKKSFPFMLLIAALLLTLALASGFLVSASVGVVVAIVSAICLVLHFPISKAMSKDPNEAVKKLLTMEIEKLKIKVDEEKESLHQMLFDHNSDVDSSDFSVAVSSINNRAREYYELRRKKDTFLLNRDNGFKEERETLSNKKEKAELYQKKQEECLVNLSTAFEAYGYTNVDDYGKELEDLLLTIKELDRAIANLRVRSQKRAVYYQENSMASIMEAEEANHLVFGDTDEEILGNEIEDRLSSLTMEEEELLDLVNADRHQLDALCEKSDDLAEVRERFEVIEKDIAKENDKYRLVELAQKMLVDAKEKLTNEYTKPLLDSFLHYYNMLVAEDVRFFMDANSNVTMEEYGIQRNVSTLSQGLSDLVGLCLRVAFVDAMYPNERPVLFLDDPFVNLDDDKLKGTRALMEEISRKYQIIYFTCTKNREQ